jgi:Rieske Fe-S protein
MHPLIARRDVLKTLLVSTATSLIGNKFWAAKTVSEIAPAINPTVGVARIDLSAFPSLNSDGGSVRLSSTGFNVDGGTLKPIIINRISGDEFAVLDSVCTHQGCIVPPYNAASGLIVCPCHGSQYDIRGNVVGGPAQLNLEPYESAVTNSLLTIQMPDWGFNVTQTSVLNGSEKRLQLSFQTFFSSQYEVRYAPDLKTLPAAAPFAQTLSGTPGTTPLTGNGGIKSVFVVPQNGFYQIAYRMTQA